MKFPLISICIPAYKRVHFLERLLDSVARQSFRDYEVVITDDSDDRSLVPIVERYKSKFNLVYRQNPAALGTPENWNEAIRLATGQWIKLMHDDDWLAHENSLLRFVHALHENPNSLFFFSGYHNFTENTKITTTIRLGSYREKQLQKNPTTLLSSNIIGPPSVTLVRNDHRVWYDKQIKWVVDIDYYIRRLQIDKAIYIDEPLVNVSLHDEQVTQSAFRVQKIEIPENFYLLEKIGVKNLKNILVYDAFWRIVRNLNIGSIDVVRENGFKGNVPVVVQSMIEAQRKIPKALMRIGVFSKLYMAIHYILHNRNIPG